MFISKELVKVVNISVHINRMALSSQAIRYAQTLTVHLVKLNAYLKNYKLKLMTFYQFKMN